MCKCLAITHERKMVKNARKNMLPPCWESGSPSASQAIPTDRTSDEEEGPIEREVACDCERRAIIIGNVRDGEGENHTKNVRATDFKGGIIKRATVVR